MTKKPSIINDLLNPTSLPDKTKSVTLVQTHISMVFVAEEFVYKVKKPVNFGFLDFSTLEKRRYYCEQEIELNRRLSENIYLDVLPITFDGKRYSLRERSSEIVEYAVKMKRIPQDKLMRSVYERGELNEEHLGQIASMLSHFHIHARRTPEIEEFGKPERFKINTDENFEQIEKYIGLSIQDTDFQALKRWTNNFYESHEALFRKRIAEGKIRDGHGDLHMEHICFLDRFSVIDCIEFNDRFRYSDIIADMAFLLMDLEYHGGEIFSKILWDAYKDYTREKDIDALLTFYKVYRAVVRGKVNSFQVDDENIEPNKKEDAVQSASKYFQLARSYID